MTMALRRKLEGAADRGSPAHAGLVLARYLRTPVKTSGHDDDRSGIGDRSSLLLAASKACQNTMAVYKHAFDEREAHFRAIRAYMVTARTETRLAVGLGTASPIEVGLRLHHTWGVPIIPGSALKGVCAHAWPAWAGTQGLDEHHQARAIIFGDPGGAGFITFHDAWITPDSLPKCLLRDVMTPHHGDYYSEKQEDGGRVPPTDFDSPNPIPFVSVRGTMHFALSCADDSSRGKRWPEYAAALLQFALEHLGVGAKTTSGYGRFSDFKSDLRSPPAPASGTTA